MLGLNLEALAKPSAQVLFIGAHCDDIEIGCGGTISRLKTLSPGIDIRWLVLSSTDERQRELMSSARRFLQAPIDECVRVESFRDGFLPWHGAEVKECFESVKHDWDPTLIFTHYREDRHQDHRLVSDLTWNTWRHHLILEYEIPKYDGDLGNPNLYVPLRKDDVAKKIDAVMSVYGSQASKDWFDAETLSGLMRIRGVEARAPEGYAEAFYGRKVVLGI